MIGRSPKAVVFDLGKVLLDFDYDIAARRILDRSSSTIEKVQASLAQSELLVRYEKGEVTSEQFFQQIRKATGFNGAYQEFSEFFCDIFFPMDSMISLLKAVKKRGLPTFVFSNTNELAIRHISARFEFYRKFDGYILSYEHGCMKPDPRLYEEVERRSGCRGAELAYIDDRPENIETARERQWHAILHQDDAKTRAEFEGLKLI